MSDDIAGLAARASAWKGRHHSQQARAYAAQQREFAAMRRNEGAVVREPMVFGEVCPEPRFGAAPR